MPRPEQPPTAARLRPVDLSRLSGVSTQQIRNYEEAGVLPPVPRTDSGYRVFGDAHRRALLTYRALSKGYGAVAATRIMRTVQEGDVPGALALVDADVPPPHTQRPPESIRRRRHPIPSSPASRPSADVGAALPSPHWLQVTGRSGRMRIGRGRFLALAAGVVGAAMLPTTRAAALIGTTERRERRGLAYRSVVYEVGAGDTPGTAWSAARVRRDMRAIRQELRADSVKVTGDGVERLTRTAGEAAEHGLNVWLEPTLGDVPRPDILDHLAETGRFAEGLRRQGVDVHFSVGCEFWLFVPGIVPGDHVLERIENLLKGNFDPEHMIRELRAFTARAAAVGRSVFRGRLTYAAADEEALDWIDWTPFDIVGLDYYADHPSRSAHIRDLRRYLRPGKPLSIQEYGCCTFEGAPEMGGMAWNVVDYDKQPPEVKGDLTRSESTQAAYLTGVLGAFEAMDLYAAHAFTFVSPDSPHRPDDPRLDLDMASYALVKPVQDRPGDPATDWHWERKEAFQALSRAYGRAASC